VGSVHGFVATAGCLGVQAFRPAGTCGAARRALRRWGAMAMCVSFGIEWRSFFGGKWRMAPHPPLAPGRDRTAGPLERGSDTPNSSENYTPGNSEIDTLPAGVRYLEERLSEEAAPADPGKLWTATYVLMGLRDPPERVAPLLRGVRAMNESSAYEAILAEGIEQASSRGWPRGPELAAPRRHGPLRPLQPSDPLPDRNNG